jgi:O-antigen/teichoic acid export membrane protein
MIVAGGTAEDVNHATKQDAEAIASMTDRARLTAARTLLRGTVWNIAGRAGPLLLALAATPFLVEALGLARWGVFALALSLTAMFGMFDLGIGRALTRLVAAGLGRGEEDSGDVATGLVLLAGLGAAGGLAAAAAGWVFAPLLGVAVAEVRGAVMVLAVAGPLVLVNAGLWGVLAAHQRFAAANLATLPILAVYYLGPLAALAVWDSLIAAVAVLVVCRGAMTLVYWRLVRGLVPGMGRPRWAAVGPLLRQGGWLAVGGLVAAVAQHLDRFVIAARLSAEAAALYATPFDLVIRIAVLGQAVLAGGFPAMATALAQGGAGVGRLFRHALLGVLGLVVPPCLVAALFAETILGWWLGPVFAAGSAGVMRFLAVGVIFAAIDGVAAALIDGAGRARANAVLGGVELALFLPALWGVLGWWGIEGAAMLWAGRMAAVAAVRMGMAVRLLAG